MQLITERFDNNIYVFISILLFVFLLEQKDLFLLSHPNERTKLIGNNPVASVLNSDIVDDDDTTLVIEQNVNSSYYYALFGYINGDKCEVIKLGAPEWDGDKALPLNANEWADMLCNYDYVYLYSLNDSFIYDYWYGIEDDWPTEYGLYRINNKNGKIDLELVEVDPV